MHTTDRISARDIYQKWTPSLAIKGFIAVLSGGGVITLWQPALWPWALAGIFASHFILTMAGLWPRSRILGPNLIRLPDAAAARNEIALTIDDGPDPEVTPQVLDILERHHATATFFCIGQQAAQHPELCRDILRRGHAIENHSQHHHVLFSLFGPRRTLREIQQAQRTLSAITGQTPRFFRPTAGLRNLFLDPLLSATGMRLACWSRRGFDTRETDPARVLARLQRNLKAGDILLLHDGNAARTGEGVPVIVAVLPLLLERIKQEDLHTVTLGCAE
jgi:peptidoglycan/xylan/chitin deacetylase (PgdA/CDA1 family)